MTVRSPGMAEIVWSPDEISGEGAWIYVNENVKGGSIAVEGWRQVHRYLVMAMM